MSFNNYFIRACPLGAVIANSALCAASIYLTYQARQWKNCEIINVPRREVSSTTEGIGKPPSSITSISLSKLFQHRKDLSWTARLARKDQDP